MSDFGRLGYCIHLARRVPLKKDDITPEAELTQNRNRWLIIVAGIFANACCGAGYAFSVIKGPLMTVLHRADSEVSLAYSLSVVFLPLGMLVSGPICAKRGPRLTVALGGIIFGAGMFLSGFSQSLLWLCATYGAMVSVGQGLSYGTVITTAVRWFPDRKGLASGLVVSALGLGTLIVAPLAQSMIGSDPIRVLYTLKTLGVCVVVIVCTAALFIVDPPKDYAPAGLLRARQQGASATGEEIGWRTMLTRPFFWALFVLYTLGTFSGHMVLTQASGLAHQVTGLTVKAAAFVVGVLGVANATGRLFWGGISDRIGRLAALAAMFTLTAVFMLLLPTLALHREGLMLCLVFVGLCYGGFLGTFPSLCADAFGTRNMAVNYALLFIAFGVAGTVGPRLGALLHAGAGSPPAFTLAACIAAVGLGLTVVLKLRRA